MQSTHRGGENHLADLGSDLETNHVQGGRQLRVEVQGEVTERRQAEQRNLDGVEQLDDGDTDRIVEHAAQADARTLAEMHAAYTDAARLEWMFWDSAYRMQTWSC